MPDRYMSGRVVTAGMSSADSYNHPELKIEDASVGNGTARVIPDKVQKGNPLTLPAIPTKVTAGTPDKQQGGGS
jgi:hypothetical protein